MYWVYVVNDYNWLIIVVTPPFVAEFGVEYVTIASSSCITFPSSWRSINPNPC
jgi:hypothetical protein